MFLLLPFWGGIENVEEEEEAEAEAKLRRLLTLAS